MDDDDFRMLIAIVGAELRAVGAADIADERHYTVRGEDHEARLKEPQDRLIAMLEAFDRFLAIQDRATYDLALATIADHIKGEGPSNVTVALTADGEAREVDLGATPDLTPIRKELDALIRNLREGTPRPRGELA